MVLVEFDGRQIPIPITDLLQMMGGDAGALQSLLGEGNEDSSDDDESSDDEFDQDSIDSDPDEEPAPVVDEEAIDAEGEDSDSDQSFQDAAAAAPYVATGGPAAAAGAHLLDVTTSYLYRTFLLAGMDLCVLPGCCPNDSTHYSLTDSYRCRS
jgi:hypothetical protein